MKLDDDKVFRLGDMLGDAYEVAEGLRQVLFALSSSNGTEDIDRHLFVVLANQQEEIVSLLQEAVAIVDEEGEEE